ncbi:eukaryotic translation initiation factor 1A [Striga asiatica]|uniref:Eukaryotic translation initiation factor 4C n=1 Tax=Striga asiatica TaxID=4170 RepID=A0A5A7QMU1_STRAF|nr:eukaryotic translation initiation factor 1A [Striga asiatica]
MPKNKGKGGKNRKRGKNEADDEKRELVFKEDGQEYAQVLRMLGNGRCEAMCIDGVKRLCHIRGKMHKKVWIAAGDIILVGLRDYQFDCAIVLLLCSANQEFTRMVLFCAKHEFTRMKMREVQISTVLPFKTYHTLKLVIVANFDRDDKADVILKYMADEARLLKAYGELPEGTRLNEGIAGGLDEEDDGPADDYIEFEDDDIDKL